MMPLVVIDAGHGGKDPGAVGFGLRESDVTLRFALMLRDELGAYEVRVHLTRATDVFLELSERAAVANRLGASLFVSPHCNAGGGTGFESYIYTKAGEATAAIQNAIHGELAAYMAQHGIRDRGKKRANYAVLRETRMAAVLLELAFIDNEHDNRLLRDDGFLRGAAAAAARGIAKALGLRRKAASPTASKVTQAASQKPAEVQKCTIVFGDRKMEGIIYEDRSYAPVRALAEALGLKVEWDARTKSVHIQK